MLGMKAFGAFSAAFLCASLLAAQAKGASIDPHLYEDLPTPILSPHFLYMKKLREYLASADYPWSSSSVGDNLLSTSLETRTTSGEGASSNGFIIKEGNKIGLEFMIPTSKSEEDFPDIELWLFADKEGLTQHQRQDVSFLVEATIDGTKNKRRHQTIDHWDTREDCVVLNMTSLGRKLYRTLQKRGLNESLVTLTVEITYVEEAARMVQYPRDILRSDICSYLSRRGSNDSFLIVKNYNQTEVMSKPPPEPAQNNNNNNNNTSNDTASNCCRKTKLSTNLPRLYGKFFKAPDEDIDVGDCTGECISLWRLFSHHAAIKQRMKLTPQCVPATFKPLPVVIETNEKMYAIVALSDILVDKCACR